jgi:hypothetical protein
VLGEQRVHDLFNLQPLFLGDEPVVDRHRDTLGLDQGVLYGLDLLAQPRLDLVA